MITLSLSTILSTAREVVRDKGSDYKYEHPANHSGTCYNVWEGQPSCLVGTIFAELGVPLVCMSDLRPVGGVDRSTAPSGSLINQLVADKQIAPPSDAVRRFLSTIQGAQDAGSTWGESLFLGVGNLIDYGFLVESSTQEG